MLKKVLFAIVPVFLFTVALRADDALSLNLSDIQDADVSIVEEGLNLDVDQLAADAGTQSEDEAIEACFRGYRSYGYRSYGYRSYGYGCNYGYRYYRPYYCHRPVYYAPVCYTPCYTSYWGCY
ncbi:hypothetical protein LOC68_02635 [Blastopirellula sp. JC732]|uniref:Uncharacterized protein n=1 Tax=Blastopirellula sediminis TaxID=2894196 RepID=A0A9X1SE17_9BACT|nr:hypothetical protein [Blastopirellula sediminis]MCC9607927.1 hypothetical protein [Blastopirellula sediminis]MCC9627280.1 hypothetical protein [Blastopirellula sediminis]